MPRIAQPSLVQINHQIDIVDTLVSQVANLQKQLTAVGGLATASDPVHAPQTSNNLVFTWTGSSSTLSWASGWVKDKNWSSQNTTVPAAISSAPGQIHSWNVFAGSISLAPSTYFWLGWDPDGQVMRATTDVSSLHGDEDIKIICKLYTGSSSQSGTAGGGGAFGTSDLSGGTYNQFLSGHIFP